MAEKIVQTAGRDALGTFAPEFAHYNDDVLFGENWNNQDIDVKTRCMLTVSQQLLFLCVKLFLRNKTTIKQFFILLYLIRRG